MQGKETPEILSAPTGRGDSGQELPNVASGLPVPALDATVP